MRSKSVLVIAVTCLWVGMSGCSKSDGPTDPGNPGNGTTVDVFTPGLVFSPSFLSVAVGTTVRFNITGVAHDVTFQSVTGAPQSIPVTTNQVVSRQFNAKGTFPYDCRTHPGMSGSVTVQ
jgi:plastocyanin